MPNVSLPKNNLIVQLQLDRVDLVDAGANSAAFIRLTKRRETNQMDYKEVLEKLQPEHSEVIKSHVATLETAVQKSTDDLAKSATAVQDLEKACTDAKANMEDLQKKLKDAQDAEDAKENETDPDAVMKALPEAMRPFLADIIAKKAAAEQALKIAADERAQIVAKSRYEEVKSIPVDETVLMPVLKSISTEMFDILKSAAAAIDKSVLEVVGVNKPNATFTNGGFEDVQKAAKAYQVANPGVTIEKAISKALEDPQLYNAYLKGVK